MNKDYWYSRQQQWIDNQDRKDSEFVERLAKYYRQSARELEKEISRYYERYGKDNVLEFRDLLEILSDDERELLYEDMDTFAELYPEYAYLLPVRESIYKLNRLEGLHYSTYLELLHLGAAEEKEMEQHLLNTYVENYEQLLEELKIGHSFLKVNKDVAMSIIYSDWISEGNFSSRIWKNKNKLLNHLVTTYRDGITRGDNYQKIAKELQRRFDVGSYDAKRLVYTESSFVLNQAHAQAYQEAGIKRYELNAIIDKRTSDICKNMHGKRFNFKDKMVGFNFPPFHPFCRTTFIGIYN